MIQRIGEDGLTDDERRLAKLRAEGHFERKHGPRDPNAPRFRLPDLKHRQEAAEYTTEIIEYAPIEVSAEMIAAFTHAREHKP